MENIQPPGAGQGEDGVFWRFLFRSRSLILGIASFVVVVAAVNFIWALWQPSTKVAPQQGVWASIDGSEYLLRLSGSKTIGSVLVPQLVTAWLVSIGASDVEEAHRVGPDGNRISESLIRAKFNGNPVVVAVKAQGSATAFKDMATGDADIGMASREINSSEATQLMPPGDMRAQVSEHVLGLEGIAVIVSQSNTISSLSRSNLKKIFAGQITNWSAFGTKSLPIHLYARNDNSGTYDTFVSLVLGGVPMANAKRYEDSEKLESDVASDPGGIGFIGMSYVKDTRAVSISDGTATVPERSAFTVKTEKYALSRRLYLYTAAVPQNPAAIDFVRFALSLEGQNIVRKAGFTPDLTERSDILGNSTTIEPPNNLKGLVSEDNVKGNVRAQLTPGDFRPPLVFAVVPQPAIDLTSAPAPASITNARPAPPATPQPPRTVVAVVPESAMDTTMTTSHPTPPPPAVLASLPVVAAPELAVDLTKARSALITASLLAPPPTPPAAPVVKAAPPPPPVTVSLPIPPVATTSHAVMADDYPLTSMRLQEQGKVLIKYLVKEDGSVGDCNVMTSSSNSRLDDAACAMVKRRWKFKPAMQDGKPVTEFLTAEVIFQLKPYAPEPIPSRPATPRAVDLKTDDRTAAEPAPEPAAPVATGPANSHPPSIFGMLSSLLPTPF